MQTIRVEVPAAEYDVISGNNALNELNAFLQSSFHNQKIIYVIDENVLKLHREYLISTLPGLSDSFMPLPVSEKLKSVETVSEIYKKLINSGAGRDAVLVGIGGGITGDVTGYAAATFMRGINYVQVPTTLLSMVDSSVGGKTGVNFGGIKNIIGAFYQPSVVIADFNFLDTLPDTEKVCGLGEMVKYAFLAGGEYYERFLTEYKELINLSPDTLQYFIGESVKYKANVVAEDEKEAGLRKVLNLGHTFAHGLETVLDFKLKHGQAVIAGISCAFELSGLLGLTTNETLGNSRNFLKQFSSMISFDMPEINSMLEVMGRDKKNREGKIKFVLPVAPGEIVLDVEAEIGQVIESINTGLEPFVNEN